MLCLKVAPIINIIHLYHFKPKLIKTFRKRTYNYAGFKV